MGRFLGIKFSKLWLSWFKANVLSLLAGIPALFLIEALKAWLLPAELGRRMHAYPFFIVLSIFVFFAATCLAEFLYAKRVARETGVHLGRVMMIKAVLLANLASYVILGPVYFCINFHPRTDIREFSSGTSWVKEAALTLVAVGSNGQLEAATADGQNHRVVVPEEVRDYVLSSNLLQVLYRGADDRFYFYQGGRNQLVPELGFWCRAPEMDFSPVGTYAAFLDSATHQIRVFDSTTGKFTNVPNFGYANDCSLIWSSKEDALYLRSGEDYWEIVLAPAVACRHLTSQPTDFANHYGRVGNSWSRDGVNYGHHQQGELRLEVGHGWQRELVVHSEGYETYMRLGDPAGQLDFEQAIFLEGTHDVLVSVGNYVYILDVRSRRIGPVMKGQDFIALAIPFSKQVNF